MDYHPLPNDYVESLNSRKFFTLTIVGKDPYPTDPIGIPFCKPDWSSMCDKRCSGLVVLKSLGEDVEKAKEEYLVPKDYFVHLAEKKGIAFLNISYYYLGGDSVGLKHKKYIQSTERINKEYLKKSNVIILCGQADKICWYEGDYSHLDCNEVVHPDIRNKNSKHANVRDSWKEWWSEGSLKKKYFS